MQFRNNMVLALLGALSLVDARLGSEKSAEELFPSQHRRLTQCARDGDTFVKVSATSTLMNAPKKSPPNEVCTKNCRQYLEGLTIYEWHQAGLEIPFCGEVGQNEAFQGRDLWNTMGTGECDKINICHGNAGFGWNRITVARSSVYEGHGGEEHNTKEQKRPDYFPGSISVPNPNGAGNNGHIDENCGWVADEPEPTAAPTPMPTLAPTEPKATAHPTSAPTASPTPNPTWAPTVSPTWAPTPAPSASPTSAAPTQETFPSGSTVEVNGEDCVLDDECECVETRNADIPVPSGTKGDPHFVMWNGKHYDFHGGCDLVLVDAPDYNNGQGLKIHIRTTIETWYSYVSRVVVQIGSDKLELQGGFTTRRFWHNGHALPTRKITKVNGVLPIRVGGNEVHYLTQKDHVSWKVSIHLPDGQFVSVRTIKDWMRVDIENPTSDNFGTSLGLMGSFDGDAMLGRDGATIMEDPTEFGQHWQVQGESLFLSAEGPQYPEACAMPQADRSVKRLLAEGTLTYEDAEAACAHLHQDEREDCIYDVIASSDMEMAGAY